MSYWCSREHNGLVAAADELVMRRMLLNMSTSISAGSDELPPLTNLHLQLSVGRIRIVVRL